MLPAIFISHGSPMLAVEDVAARDFLKTLPDLLPERPKAILVVSAHWERLRPALNAPARHETIHDFGGFPQALYDLQYPAPPSAGLAQRAAELLAAAGLPADIDTKRGLDHGAWVPLIVAWPDADIPVVQLSVQTRLGPEHHYRLGEALKPLRAEGVLILGSGSFTHDLSSFRSSGGRLDAPEQDWVHVFAEWMASALNEGRIDDLLHYRSRAPEAAHNHPTEEHLLPLYAALGAGADRIRHLHQSTTYGILRMDAFAFG
jgi:4,5-DOPA dioxygenase extradiol